MITKFLSELEGKFIDDVNFKLTKPLVYSSEIFNNTITIPKNFVTDFASVPRVPVVFTLFGDRAHHESVVHDFLYRKAVFVDRKIADRIFLEAMKARGKSFFVRWCMFFGVRIGGKKIWKEYYTSGCDTFIF